MIPLQFCGQDYRDWPWWLFWRKGHREHEFMGELEGVRGPFTTLAMCPGRVDAEEADDE